MERFFRRRKYIVDRDLQYGLIRAQLVLFGSALIFMAVGVFAPLVSELNKGTLSEGEQLIAATMMLYMHERMWLFFALTAVFLLLGLVRLSHKIAGPLCRFRKLVSEAKAGVVPNEIRLRRGDFLHEEALLMSELIADMAAQNDKLHTVCADVESLRSKILGTPGLNYGDRQELLEELNRLTDSLDITQRSEASV